MKDVLENIDEVVKQAFDGFEANVDPSVWSNIQNGINAGSTGGSAQADPVSSIATTSVAKSIVVKIAAAVIAVGTIATATYYIATSPKNEVVVENVVDKIENNVIVEEQFETEGSIDTEVEKKNIDEVENNSSDREEVVVEENTTPLVEEKELIKGNNSTQSNSNEEVVYNTNETKESSTSQNQQEVTNSETETNTNPTVEEKEPVKEQPKEVVKEQPKEADVNTIPNVISPNGDGQNDVIKITGTNLEKLEVAIMDKTGKIVYRLKSIDEEWNGKDQNGFDLIPGTYYIAGVVIDTDGNVKNIKQAINLFK